MVPKIYKDLSALVFLVRDQYLRSLLPYGNQAIGGQLKRHLLMPILAILTAYMETRLYSLRLNTKPGQPRKLEMQISDHCLHSC